MKVIERPGEEKANGLFFSGQLQLRAAFLAASFAAIGLADRTRGASSVAPGAVPGRTSDMRSEDRGLRSARLRTSFPVPFVLWCSRGSLRCAGWIRRECNSVPHHSRIDIPPPPIQDQHREKVQVRA